MRLLRRSRRIFVVVAMVVAMLAGWRSSWAQNENESVGFRPGHMFESGAFGENIDILNGGLNLTVPVGQHFQVTPRLDYGLTLRYNSKVWDTSHSNSDFIDAGIQVVPYNEGPFGIGFSLQMGRIFRDPQFSHAQTCGIGTNAACTDSNYVVPWKWVSPDGSQHEFFNDPGTSIDTSQYPGVSGAVGARTFDRRQTNDLSYTLISGPANSWCPAGLNASNCFRVETPDGLRYTLVQRVTCQNPSPANAARVEDDAGYLNTRTANQDFCGWYTSLIEDQTVGSPDGSTGFYPNYVRVFYDDRHGFEHAIDHIQDSVGRVIQFHNCEWKNQTNPLTTGADIQEACIDGSKSLSYPPSGQTANRRAVATYAIDVPSFSGNTSLDPSKTATYSFMYERAAAQRGDEYLDGSTANYPDPLLRLVRMDYPAYTHPGGALQDSYSLYYSYSNTYVSTCVPAQSGGTHDYSEITCRTLPLRRQANGSSIITGNACAGGGSYPRFKYMYGYYTYVAAYLSSGSASSHTCQTHSGSCQGAAAALSPTGQTRQLIKKTLEMAAGGHTDNWTYCRPMTSATNPESVTVSDPYGNDTVYSYAGSDPPPQANEGPDPQDGFAPEWNDGSNVRIDYYQGDAIHGVLIRSNSMERDSDINNGKHAKDNVRERTELITHLDDGSRQEHTSRNDWDGYGHWRTETSSGSDVTGFRSTRREYETSHFFRGGELYLPGLQNVEEVSDGQRVLSRTESFYDVDDETVPADQQHGRLTRTIARLNPSVIGAPVSPLPQPGDLVTTYDYYPESGNIFHKIVVGTGPQTYTIKYGWAPAGGTCTTVGACGAYLKSKEFSNWGSYPWKAIDRDRDANTGLIYNTRDSSNVATSYTYDALGRIASIAPTGEDPTTVDYESLLKTRVYRGTGASLDLTGYNYDGLGRQIGEFKTRPNWTTDGLSCHTTDHDAEGRVKFESEWFYVPQESDCVPHYTEEDADCSPDPGVQKGTITSYKAANGSTAPIDPFGRPRRVIPADGCSATGSKTTSTEYFGTSKRVTVHDVAGPNGQAFPAITTLRYDVLGRLLAVDSASGKVCSTTGSPCSTSAQCPTGQQCVTSDGGVDANYSYDALDRLTQVDLTSGNAVQTRRFEYDALGHSRSADNPENGTILSIDYDALGHPLSTMDSAGNLHQFTYDFAGRQLSETLTPPNASSRLVGRNTYDEDPLQTGHARGKLTKVESFGENGNPLLTIQLAYEGLGGRVSDVTHSFADWAGETEKTSYTYTSQGQVATITYPREASPVRSVFTVQYTYANGQVTSAVNTATGMVLGQVTYTSSGAIKTESTPGNGLTSIEYDDRGRPKKIDAGKSEAPDWPWYTSGNYVYDGAGNISRRDNPSDSAHPFGDYSYDAANRLIAATTRYGADTYQEAFTYDALGNMLAKSFTHNGGYSVNESLDPVLVGGVTNNRVSTSEYWSGTSSWGLVNFLYDTSGNVTQGGRVYPLESNPTISVTDVQRFIYSVQNRLVQTFTVGTPSSSTNLAELATYSYDSGGQRISHYEAGRNVKTYYIRDQAGQVLSEFRSPLEPMFVSVIGVPEWSKDYITLAGRLLAMRENQRPEPPGGLVMGSVPSPPGGPYRLKVTWNQNTESDRASYTVYRFREDIDSTFVSIGSVPPGSLTTVTFSDPDYYYAGQLVMYRVTCTDTAGYESLQSSTVQTYTADVTKPSRPVLSAVAGDRQIQLNFSSYDPSGLRGYRIYRGTTPTALSLVNSQFVIEPVFTDVGLLNGQNYYYQVEAVDSLGKTSDKSCSGSPCALLAVPKDFTPPIPPRGLTVCNAEDTSGSVNIAWEKNPATDNVIAYRLYRNTNPVFDASAFLVYEGSGTSVVDSGLTPGSYYYAVKAVDSGSPANISQLSLIRSVVIQTPFGTIPSGLAAQGLDGRVVLRWSQAQIAVDKYEVYRKRNAGDVCYSKVGELVPGAPGASVNPTFTDDTVPNNAAYDYRVTAVRSGGESLFSRRVVGIPLARPTYSSQCRRVLNLGESVGYGDDYGSNLLFQWTPPYAEIYQQLYAGNLTQTPAYLIGYHLYHYSPASVPGTTCEDGGGCEGRNDQSAIRQMIGYDRSSSTDPWPLDPYRLGANYTRTTEVLDPQVPLDAPVSPPFYTPGTLNWFPLDGTTPSAGMFYGENQTYSTCALPKAVYKVYVDGTWMTVESDWPDYFDNMAEDPYGRCFQRIDHDPLSCGSEVGAVPGPSNVTQRTGDEPGSMVVAWSPPVISANQPSLAGYYLYASRLEYSDPLEWDRTLPIAVLGASETSYTAENLGRLSFHRIYWYIAAFDSSGHRSITVAATGTGVGFALPSVETVQPGVPRGLRTIIWTLNDKVALDLSASPVRFPLTRRGIKLLWNRVEAPSGWVASEEGYRVYRSTTPDGAACALLGSGTRTIALPANTSACLSSDAASADFSSAAGVRHFYDSTPTQGQIFYYRVTELRKDASGVVRETPLPATEEVAGRVMPYRENVMPPPQNFKAWAPAPTAASGTDPRGIAMRWCPVPSAAAGDPMPTVTEYRIYRRFNNPDRASYLLARLSPGCLSQNQETKEPTARCVITSVNECVNHNTETLKLPPNDCTPIQPDASCSGAGCLILDDTFSSWPTMDRSFTYQHNNFDYTYYVTAVHVEGSTEIESVPSVQNQGWLNYCNTSPCNWRREPEGDDEFLWRDSASGLHGGTFICGDDDSQLLVPDDLAPLVPDFDPRPAARTASAGPSPYRAIGQAPPDIPYRFLFYHLDHLGSPRLILDVNGNLIAKHHYLPFGEEKEAFPDPSTNTKAFTGHERDQESGLDYMLARYYSSSLGRFMAVDPSMRLGANLTNPQRWNRYVYSLNNPLKYVDPDGQDIALSTEGRSGAVKKELVAAAMRPSGRAALQSLDSNHGVTVTYRDTRINTPQQIDQAKETGATLTTAKTTLTGETRNAQGVTTHYDVDTKIDTKAVEAIHPDPSGATTVGHEGFHAEGIAAGKTDQQLGAEEPQAEAAGKAVGAEQPDISKKEAKKIVKEMLKN